MFQKGKLENAKKEMERLKLNVLGLSEVRWKGAGSFITDNFTIIYSGGDQHERGVGMLLDKEMSKCIKGFLDGFRQCSAGKAPWQTFQYLLHLSLRTDS